MKLDFIEPLVSLRGTLSFLLLDGHCVSGLVEIQNLNTTKPQENPKSQIQKIISLLRFKISLFQFPIKKQKLS